MAKTIVVIGGGVAGISCLEAITNERNVDDVLILITDSRIIKRVRKLDTNSRLENYDVVTEDVQSLLESKNEKVDLKCIIASVLEINVPDKKISYRPLDNKSVINETLEQSYDVLCLCHGAKPLRLRYSQNPSDPEVDKRVIVLRDTNTVEELKRKLKDCRRLAIVGNGGISLELVHRVSSCEKVWIVRDGSIGSTFFDSGAAKFLLDSLSDGPSEPKKTISYGTTLVESANKPINYGPALGPNWTQDSEFRGKKLNRKHELNIIYNDEVRDIVFNPDEEYPVLIKTRCDKEVACDLVLTGIGVEANNITTVGAVLEKSCLSGGILIDEQMRTSISEIYAAGDVVSCEQWAHNELWFQMRLWTQARQMGYYAGKCIVSHLRNQDPSIYYQFDCFAHSTSFFGHKLTLLGRYNGEMCDSGDDLDVIVKVEPGKKYIKVLIKEEKVYGAVLVGETGKEDMLENMILDGLRFDEALKDCLLDDTIDLDDWYD